MKKNQTFLQILMLLMLLIAVSTSCQQKKPKENPYGLTIISNVAEYNDSVMQNPNKALVDVEKLIPGIILDIRYATKNNFTGKQIYKYPRAFVRKPVANALLQIQNELISKGLGLKIFDAYRPYSATVKFYDVYPDTNFVAAPWYGSRHNRGCAVDVTLVDLTTNRELKMPTAFDDFAEKASHSYSNLTAIEMANRLMLCEIMEKHGFVHYVHEWWHYDYIGWEKYALMDIAFEELEL